MKGIGYKITMPVMLKKRWQRAIWIVALKCSLSEASAARIPVVVVPEIPAIRCLYRSLSFK